jgi:hypothetical protein
MRMTRKYHRNSLIATTKWCPAHDNGEGARLPVSEFYRDPQGPRGLAGICKECARAERRARYSRASAEQYRRIRYQTLQGACKRKAIALDLTFDEFMGILSRPCIYGGGTSGAGIPITLDRKEPTRGYIRGNCVPSCPRHNRIKSDVFSFESMLQIVSDFPEAKACGGVAYKKLGHRIGDTIRAKAGLR